MQIPYEIPEERSQEYRVFDQMAERRGKPSGLVKKLEEAIKNLPDGWIKADKIIVEYFGIPTLDEKDFKVRISPGGKKLFMNLPIEIPSFTEMYLEDENPNSVTFINFRYDETNYVVASRRNTSFVDSPKGE